MNARDRRQPVEVTVEIPSGSRNKYEYDHRRRRLVMTAIRATSWW